MRAVPDPRPVQEAFAAARRLAAPEREALLARVDEATAREVRALLAEHDEAERAGATPPGAALRAAFERAVAEARAADPRIPERIGPFRILGLLGAGGMGAVYDAEQDAPRRRVALKVIRPDLLTPRARRRFEDEAQALARLAHPGVARIYAMGAGNGAEPPWIAMERVEGRSLAEHVRAARPGLRARVTLLAEVAEAVAHAHAHGVIHRDLKPSNVVVGADGHAKVLDFGVARLLGSEGAAATRSTGGGGPLGTLAYMSPEQAAGDGSAVDARSDVYALGVLAFEILSGRLPLDVDSLPLPAAALAIATAEPPALGTLDPALRGDASWIVAKALEKDPARRYATAAAFADDLRRFLADQPILARPPTAGYQLRKLVRRHRSLFAGLAAGLVALVVGLVLALLSAHEAREARAVADRKSAEAERASYRAQVAAAEAALDRFDHAAARRHLDAAPGALRGWEWGVLDAALSPYEAERRVPLDGCDAWLDAGGEPRVGVDERGRARLLDTGGGLVDLGGGWIARPAFFLGGGRLLLAREREGYALLDPAASAPAVSLLALGASPGGAAVETGGARAVLSWPDPNGATEEPGLQWFDLGRGAPLGSRTSLPAAKAGAHAVALSPDGRQLATTGWDHRVRLWDAGTLTLERELEGHTQWSHALAWSPDGTRLASGSDDRTVRVWDAARGSEVLVLRGHAGAVSAVRFRSDGGELATAARDGTVRLWGLPGGDPTAALPAGEPGTRCDVAYTAGARPVTLSGGRLRTWDPALRSALEVLRPHRGLAEGNRSPYVYGVAFDPQGRRLLTGGWDGTARLVVAATGDTLATFELGGFVHAVAYDPTGRRFAAASTGTAGAVALFDAATGERVGRAPSLETEARGALAFAPDGARLLAAQEGGGLAVLSAADGAEVGRWDGHATKVYACAFSADGRLAATGSRDGLVLLREGGAGTSRARLDAQAGSANAVAFSPDAALLATAHDDGRVRLWRTADGVLLRTLAGHAGQVYALAFLPDGSRLVSGAADATVRVWDPADGEPLLTLSGHGAYVIHLAVAPDGLTFASASGDNSVRLWSRRPWSDRFAAARARRAAEHEVAGLRAAGKAVPPALADVADDLALRGRTQR